MNRISKFGLAITTALAFSSAWAQEQAAEEPEIV